jgi:hypothetical protein
LPDIVFTIRRAPKGETTVILFSFKFVLTTAMAELLKMINEQAVLDEEVTI